MYSVGIYYAVQPVAGVVVEEEAVVDLQVEDLLEDLGVEEVLPEDHSQEVDQVHRWGVLEEDSKRILLSKKKAETFPIDKSTSNTFSKMLRTMPIPVATLAHCVNMHGKNLIAIQ